MTAAILTVPIDVSATTQTVAGEHKLRWVDVWHRSGGRNLARVLKRLEALLDLQAVGAVT
jgi:hypothetical protein